MGGAPKPPDPYKVAAAQSGMNTDTALTQQLVNMTTQNNPWGSVSYEQSGKTGFVDSTGKYREIPQFTQNTTYTPQQQAIFDANTQAQTNLANISVEQSAAIRDYLNDRFQFQGGPDVVGMANNPLQAPDDFQFNNQDAANWAYDLGSQRLLPQQQQDRKALEAQLVNRGLRPGTNAWNSELERLGRTQTDQMNQLALTGRQQAYNEAAGAYGMNWQTDLSARQNQFNEAFGARDQAFREAVTQRNQPLNEISALMSGSQIANPGQQSSATPQTSVAGVDYAGLVNSNYQAQVAQHNAMMGGLFGLAGTAGQAAMFSDRRVKTDIRKVGVLDNGLPVYAYRYAWGGPLHIGVMAQDVAEVNPDAVQEMAGILSVDYEKAVQ